MDYIDFHNKVIQNLQSESLKNAINESGLIFEPIELFKIIYEYIDKYAAEQGVECYFFQSNSEGELIDAIQSVYYDFDGCILNAGAYTHYSYAIRDAITSIGKPVIEVHMSDIYKREEFRHVSVIKDVCRESVLGHGKDSYIMAVDAIKKYL